MNIKQNYTLFLLELKDLFDKYLLTLNDEMFFMDKEKHYSLQSTNDSFILHCFETNSDETIDIPELKKVTIDDFYDDYSANSSDDDYDSFDPLSL